MKPTSDVLKAFGCAGELTSFDGGQGWAWRCGGVVLKPVGLAVEAEWGAEVFASLEQVGFTVPRPILANHGGYVYRGWAASEFVAGEHPPVG
ncbi:MAG: TIGR02569 family protein, partial [Armatimonadetes bacterium]|nr:TIGR02569 family protein [Armatimonadota bacterium]